ncbi:ATP-binding protein [Marivirga arenosa]|uniref:ATP-binding protein n=1 Tax=Marivirga arenosa TaxID=3059076 RepID=A0AA49GHK3_9BACT|nr:ATP-binding protein [Marivirga sp. BKB1-2]WKK83226.2 ATP-binding protein [Marivirga sp. BKB1-2]
MKKIAIIGPESTGKSTITAQLARYYNEPFVEEFGRKYLEKTNGTYNREDLLAITKGMIESEKSLEKKATNFLFCDTDLIMMKVWYEVKYGECHPLVLDRLDSKPYDHYLLCYPDLPWEDDPLRENPNMREELFERYLKELNLYNFPFSIVKGKINRFMIAANEIERLKNDN